MSELVVSVGGPRTTLAARAGDYGMSFPEAASVIGVSTRTVIRRVKAGDIHSVMVTPRRRVILASEVARILSGGGEGALRA